MIGKLQVPKALAGLLALAASALLQAAPVKVQVSIPSGFTYRIRTVGSPQGQGTVQLFGKIQVGTKAGMASSEVLQGKVGAGGLSFARKSADDEFYLSLEAPSGNYTQAYVLEKVPAGGSGRFDITVDRRGRATVDLQRDNDKSFLKKTKGGDGIEVLR